MWGTFGVPLLDPESACGRKPCCPSSPAKWYLRFRGTDDDFAKECWHLAMSSEEYASDCDSVTETEGSGDEQLEAEAVIVGGEVDRYLLDPIENPKDREKWSILDWWRCNGSKYPNLQAVARDVLAIQVSTVASESSFSTGKRVIDPHRSSLTPRTVEALICLQNWLKSDAIMGLQYIPSIEEMGWFEDVEKEQAEEERIRLEKLQLAIQEEELATQQSRKAAKVLLELELEPL
ncbi:hypothetical protein ACLB2K_025820 [Fragaria x ananassa]